VHGSQYHLIEQARVFANYNFGFDKYDFGYGSDKKGYRLGQVKIKRLGVTMDQILHYNIPMNIDEAIEDKLFGNHEKKGDPRTNGFIERYRKYMNRGDMLPRECKMASSLSHLSETYSAGIPQQYECSRCHSPMNRLYLRSKQGKRPFLAHSWYCTACKFFTTDAALARRSRRLNQREQLKVIAGTRRELREVRDSLPEDIRWAFVTRRRPIWRDLKFDSWLVVLHEFHYRTSGYAFLSLMLQMTKGP
jgi:hypothetical protein